MQFRRRHIVLTALWLFLTAVACSLLSSCTNDPETIRALTGDSFSQADRAHNVTFLYSQNGNVTMRIFAQEFAHGTTAKRAYVDMNKDLKIEFFNDAVMK